MLPAILLFVLTYALMLLFSRYRPYIALSSGALFIASGMLPLFDVFGALDFNGLRYVSAFLRE